MIIKHFPRVYSSFLLGTPEAPVYTPEGYEKVLKEKDTAYAGMDGGIDDGKKTLEEYNPNRKAAEILAVFPDLDAPLLKECLKPPK